LTADVEFHAIAVVWVVGYNDRERVACRAIVRATRVTLVNIEDAAIRVSLIGHERCLYVGACSRKVIRYGHRAALKPACWQLVGGIRAATVDREDKTADALARRGVDELLPHCRNDDTKAKCGGGKHFVCMQGGSQAKLRSVQRMTPPLLANDCTRSLSCARVTPAERRLAAEMIPSELVGSVAP